LNLASISSTDSFPNRLLLLACHRNQYHRVPNSLYLLELGAIFLHGCLSAPSTADQTLPDVSSLPSALTCPQHLSLPTPCYSYYPVTAHPCTVLQLCNRSPLLSSPCCISEQALCQYKSKDSLYAGSSQACSYLVCLWDHIVGTCQLQLQAGSNSPSLACDLARISVIVFASGLHAESYSQACIPSHCDGCNLTLPAGSWSTAAQAMFFSCCPDCATAPFPTLSWFPFLSNFSPLPCFRTQMQHILPHTPSLVHCRVLKPTPSWPALFHLLYFRYKRLHAFLHAELHFWEEILQIMQI